MANEDGWSVGRSIDWRCFAVSLDKCSVFVEHSLTPSSPTGLGPDQPRPGLPACCIAASMRWRPAGPRKQWSTRWRGSCPSCRKCFVSASTTWSSSIDFARSHHWYCRSYFRKKTIFYFGYCFVLLHKLITDHISYSKKNLKIHTESPFIPFSSLFPSPPLFLFHTIWHLMMHRLILMVHNLCNITRYNNLCYWQRVMDR